MRALLTSNFEKSLKKNETVRCICTSVRSVGSVGLSLPAPPSIAHHFPVQCGGGRLLHTTAARGSLRAARRLAGRCAPELMPEVLSYVMPGFSSCTLDSTSAPSSLGEMTPSPLETA